jgi:hypothetical protein
VRQIVAAEQRHRDAGRAKAMEAVWYADDQRVARLELEAGAFVELEAGLRW